MPNTQRFFAAIIFIYALGIPNAMAQTRAEVEGYVWSGSTPLCALVLANGQSMFSCSPDGPFELTNVPTDGNGEITVQIFAAGFAPYRETLSPSGSVPTVSLSQVNMLRVNNGREFEVEASAETSNIAGWQLVSGTVSSNGEPVCALVLINGQQMFSCNNDLGRFSLNVPPDQNGDVTAQIFAAGFQPFKKDVDEIGNNSSPGDVGDLTCSVYAAGTQYCAEGSFPNCRVTKEQALQVSSGMTYEQVVEIFGCHGNLAAFSGPNASGISAATYQWGSNIVTNYVVVSMSSSGGVPTVRGVAGP